MRAARIARRRGMKRRLKEAEDALKLTMKMIQQADREGFKRGVAAARSATPIEYKGAGDEVV